MHEGSQRFHELLKEIGELHDKKQQDYGSDADPFANVRASERWGVPGWAGALLRAGDKLARLQAFARKGVLANESAEDSMKDIAVYALIALVLYEQESMLITTTQPEPMSEVQHSSDEQYHSQAVLHDAKHSATEGTWHYHDDEGTAWETTPSDPKSKEHKHIPGVVG